MLKNEKLHFQKERLFLPKNILFFALEKPKNYEATIEDLKKGETAEKWKMISIAIEAYFDQNPYSNEDDFDNRFTAAQYFEYIHWKAKYLMAKYPETFKVAADTMSDGEKRILDALYEKKGEKIINKHDELIQERNQLNQLIGQNNIEIQKLSKESGPANAQKIRDLTEKNAKSIRRVKEITEMLENSTALLSTYKYFMMRHVRMREHQKKQFTIERAGAEKNIGDHTEELFEKGYDYFTDNWSQMTGKEKTYALLGGVTLLYWLSHSESETGKKLWSYAKFVGLTVVGFSVFNKGLMKAITGGTVGEGIDKIARKVKGKDLLNRVFKIDPKQKIEEFEEIRDKFVDLLQLLTRNNVQAKDVIKAYYEAYDKDTSTKKDKGTLTIPGIPVSKFSPKEQYLALKFFFDALPARKNGLMDPPLTSPYFKNLPFAKYFLYSVVHSKKAASWTGDKDIITKTALKMYETAKQGGKAVVDVLGKAIENAPEYIKEKLAKPGVMKDIYDTVTSGTDLAKKVFGFGTDVLQKAGIITQNTIQAVDQLIKGKNYKEAVAVLIGNQSHKKELEALNAFQLQNGNLGHGKHPNLDNVKDAVEAKFSSKTIARHGFIAGINYLKTNPQNNNSVMQSSEAYYIIYKRPIQANSPRENQYVDAKSEVAALIARERNIFPGIVSGAQEILANLKVAMSGQIGNDQYIFFRICKDNTLVDDKGNAIRHIHDASDYENFYEYISSAEVYAQSIKPHVKNLPTGIDGNKIEKFYLKNGAPQQIITLYKKYFGKELSLKDVTIEKAVAYMVEIVKKAKETDQAFFNAL